MANLAIPPSRSFETICSTRGPRATIPQQHWLTSSTTRLGMSDTVAARSVEVRWSYRLQLDVFNYVEVVEGRRALAEGHHAL